MAESFPRAAAAPDVLRDAVRRDVLRALAVRGGLELVVLGVRARPDVAEISMVDLPGLWLAEGRGLREDSRARREEADSN